MYTMVSRTSVSGKSPPPHPFTSPLPISAFFPAHGQMKDMCYVCVPWSCEASGSWCLACSTISPRFASAGWWKTLCNVVSHNESFNHPTLHFYDLELWQCSSTLSGNVLKFLVTCTGIPQMLQHLLNCQLIDRIKLPVHFFTTIITTIPMTVAKTTINAIPAERQKCTYCKWLMFSDVC